MPMDRPYVQATRNQRLAKAKNEVSVSQLGRSFQFQILGNSSRGNPGTVLVSSDDQNYMFNCSEGLQRLAGQNSAIKMAKIQNIFVTSLDWAKISGVFGFALTLHDIGLPRLCLHGPEGIDSLFTSIAGFVDHSKPSLTSWELTTRTPEQGDFISPSLEVKYVQIQPSSHNQDSLVNQTNQYKRPKTNRMLLTYICKTPDTVGALDISKCKELGVPIGPKLAMLKNGKDVTLDDGRHIKSMDVVEKRKPGSLFLVVECPNVSYIDSLVKNSDITEAASMRTSDVTGEVSFIIHYCSDNVLQDERYILWMKQFPSECKHIIMNESNSCVNFIALHRHQINLNLCDSRIFPRLAEDLRDELKESAPRIDSTNIIRPGHFDKYILRPREIFEPGNIVLDRNLYREEAHKVKNFDENLAKLHKLQEEMKLPNDVEEEPELVFFGTGASIPSKYRNASCIYLKMSNENCMLMDCGEGSFGQMFRFFGDKIGNVLSTMRLIYISHYHADHHLGLIEIMKQRRAHTDEPLLIVGPSQIKIWLEHFCKTFEDLSSYYKYYPSHVFENIDERRTTSKQLLETSLKTKDEWQPPSVVANVRYSTCQDSSLKKELLHRLPILKDIQLIKVRHCTDSYAIFLKLNLPEGNIYSLAYSGDAMPSNELISRAQGCDLLIHEATFSDHKKNDARLKRHSTFSQAIEVGKKMGAGFTLLTHFTQRYAKIVLFNENFDEKVGFAFDNMRLSLPSDLRRIPILKPTLNALYSEEIAEMEAAWEKEEMRQERIAKYLDEHQNTTKLNVKEVLQRTKDDIEKFRIYKA